MAEPQKVPTCKIQWIDDQGNPTPDQNLAVGFCRVEAYSTVIGGRTIHFPDSEWFPICAEHMKQLPMPHWVFRSLAEGEQK